MSLYKKMKNVFASKAKEEDEGEMPLSREDLEELEKIIRASKEALFGMKKRQKEKLKKEKRARSKAKKAASSDDDQPTSKQDQRARFEQILDEYKVKDEDFEFLESGSRKETRSAHAGGIAFEVDFEPARKVKAKPKEPSHQETPPIKTLVDYSSEEKTLMAEIIREDFLTERSHKAAQEELKRFDATRRRLVISADAEARIAQRENDAATHPSRDAEERDKRLQKLADKAKEARIAAASTKNKVLN